jgi:hypothetical protein
MTKQTGTIITIVVAVLSLCCSSFCCLLGGGILFGGGEWSTDLGIPQAGQIEPIYGGGPCCLSILILVVPSLLCWLFLVRGKEDTMGIEMEEEYEGIIEDDISYE